MLGLAKDYLGSTVHLDLVDDVLSNREVKPIRYSSFVPENYANAENRPLAEREPTPERAVETETPQENAVQEEKKGHCIRCNTVLFLLTLQSLCATAVMKRG